MPCYRPIHGFRGHTNANGKKPIVFSRRDATAPSFATDIDRSVKLPCGQCIGCRLEKSRQWALRCVHEASLYENNCFITLTYDEENLPKNKSLNKNHFQNFIRSLRDKIRYDASLEPKHRIFNAHNSPRYFHCGEYGDANQRPHYHAILFNFTFPDQVLFKRTDTGNIYESKILNETWQQGFCTLGAVTFESAAYVARYALKKINGPGADDHYGGRTPEYTTMSRRPGIGRGWYEKFKSDTYPSDSVALRGKLMKPPAFYDKILSLDDPELFRQTKLRRLSDASCAGDSEENQVTRLRVKEICKETTIKQQLERKL